MIRAVGIDIPSDVYDVSFRRSPLNERSAQPMLIGIGDDEYGPLVGLFYDDPSEPDMYLARPDLAPAHSHPADNFRICMKGELWVGSQRYHHGEFRLQRSGTPYGADGDAPHPEGNWRVISFADRRGFRVRPTNRESRAESATPERFAMIRERFGPVLQSLLPDDDDGIQGCVTTIEKNFSKLGHVDSSLTESYTWATMGNGGNIVVTLMGEHTVGPIYIVQRTPARAQATPAVTFDSDLFRIVVQGSAVMGDHEADMGDARFQAGGIEWGEVTAGDTGLVELIVIGDRRGAAAIPTGDQHGWAERLDELVTGLVAQLPELAASV
jgi:hypothetical protein